MTGPGRLSARQVQEKTLRTDAKNPKAHKVAYVLEPGHVWNPAASYPRNAKCFCKSGKKAKACCLLKLKTTVPAAKAAEIAELVKMAQGLHAQGKR